MKFITALTLTILSATTTSASKCAEHLSSVSTCFASNTVTCSDLSCVSTDASSTSDVGAMKACCPACSEVIESFSACVSENVENVQVPVIDNLKDSVENISNEIISNSPGVDDFQDLQNAANELIGTFGSEEVLCGENSAVETLITEGVLAAGEIDLECAKDAAAVSTCLVCNADECSVCSAKFQLQTEDVACQKPEGFFGDCGCNTCKEKERALLNCRCSSAANSNQTSENAPGVDDFQDLQNAANELIGIFTEVVLCGENSAVETLITEAVLADGETNLECAKDAAAVATCLVCNADECSICSAKFQLQTEDVACQKLEGFFGDCGCNTCKEKERALLNCQCSSATNLGFWTVLAAIPLTISFLMI